MFKTGEKHAGRPKNAGPKEVFNVQTVINNRFPGSKTALADRLRVLDGAKASPGRDYLKRYYSGGKLSARQAAIANCCYCNGYYADGKNDCENPLCSIYFMMPYRSRGKK
jgi:hypothetical protein